MWMMMMMKVKRVKITQSFGLSNNINRNPNELTNFVCYLKENNYKYTYISELRLETNMDFGLFYLFHSLLIEKMR